MKIDVERLVLEFKNLLEIESPSKKEGKLAYYLASIFEALGYKCFFDKSAETTGSEVGNLIVKIPGSIPAEPIFFCAHLDTVGPYKNPKIIFENNVFRTDGRTILGADDKSGIAALVEVAKILKETSPPHPPLEYIFTTCEEIGLLGAKCLDTELIDAREGFVLDSEDPEEVINAAPSSYQFEIRILGKSAHAGIEPEKGINAIKIASEIISGLPCGRIDEETTFNIGTIRGGEYVNIVPDKCEVKGEMRSHNENKLQELKNLIEEKIESVIENHPKIENLPAAKVHFNKVFKAFFVPEDDPLCQLVKKAGENLGMRLNFKRIEGGSDANVFNEKGLKCLVLGTGMRKVHTTEEYIHLKDLILTTDLVLEIIKVKSEMAG